jgi:hypothetical protein
MADPSAFLLGGGYIQGVKITTKEVDSDIEFFRPSRRAWTTMRRFIP